MSPIRPHDCQALLEAWLAGAPEGNAASAAGSCPSCCALTRLLGSLRHAELPPPPRALVSDTLARLAPVLRERDRRRRLEQRRIALRLGVASLAALPFLALLNGGYAWLVSTIVGRFAPPALASLAGLSVVASTLLGLSLLFGALPFLTRFAVDARRGALPVEPSYGTAMGASQ